jgi:signal transduction histidine kinase
VLGMRSSVRIEHVVRAMFERAPSAICVTQGPRHVIAAANPRFWEIVPVARTLGTPLPEAFGSPDLYALLDGVSSTGIPVASREVPIHVGAEGRLSYFNCVYQPLSREGTADGVVVHAADVTDLVLARHGVEEKAVDLERLARELEAANEELDRFAYVTSHDLRAPLRGIGNLVHWIEEDLGESATAETQHHLAMLKARVRRLDELIDGILRYSRAGRQFGGRERVDTGRLVEEIVDLLDAPPDAEIEITEPMPVLDTERVPLAQVLSNLICNAIQYGRSERGLHVRIGAERSEGLFTFAVSDDGPGIEPRFQERIWGMFQTLSRGESTGVGLSLVRKIVEARGGRAWVESRPGSGARFAFTWPEQTSEDRPGSGP